MPEFSGDTDTTDSDMNQQNFMLIVYSSKIKMQVLKVHISWLITLTELPC